MIEQLVEAQPEEITEHDFHYRSVAPEREPIADADDTRLADRCIDDTPRKLVGKAARGFECTPVWRAHVFT